MVYSKVTKEGKKQLKEKKNVKRKICNNSKQRKRVDLKGSHHTKNV